ncbi:MAG: DUF1294 domain-containing protein [Candidatus Howiella sp.]|jgi:uncharacterized membrane protein YsdA (DUF1294 family)
MLTDVLRTALASKTFWTAAGAYLSLIWLLAVFLTVLDKRRAKTGGCRVRERTLLLIGFLGGALPMLCTMRAIRHKTLHKKFMIGLPVFVGLHGILLIAVVWVLTNGPIGNII